MIAGNSQKSLDTIEITHSPSLKTSIVEATIIFLFLLKSILFSIKTFKPFTAKIYIVVKRLLQVLDLKLNQLLL
jgi:hypothetical protein